MDHDLGPAAVLARANVGVSLKVELRKPRDGEVASRNGCASSASSMMVQWSGSLGIAAIGPAWIGAAERHCRPVRLETKFAVRIGEAVEVVGGVEIRLAVDPFLALKPLQRAPAGYLQRPVDQFARAVMAKPGCWAPRRLASAQITS